MRSLGRNTRLADKWGFGCRGPDDPGKIWRAPQTQPERKSRALGADFRTLRMSYPKLPPYTTKGGPTLPFQEAQQLGETLSLVENLTERHACGLIGMHRVSWRYRPRA